MALHDAVFGAGDAGFDRGFGEDAGARGVAEIEQDAVVGGDGADFETTPLYQKHKGRVLGIVRLARLHQSTFGANVADMLARGLTFAEADASPDFFVVAKQRLRQVKRPIFDQLALVV